MLPLSLLLILSLLVPLILFSIPRETPRLCIVFPRSVPFPSLWPWQVLVTITVSVSVFVLDPTSGCIRVLVLVLVIGFARTETRTGFLFRMYVPTTRTLHTVHGCTPHTIFIFFFSVLLRTVTRLQTKASLDCPGKRLPPRF